MCARCLAEDDGVKYSARPVRRNDASIVPYKRFAAFITIGKVSPRHDEGIVPYNLGQENCKIQEHKETKMTKKQKQGKTHRG